MIAWFRRVALLAMALALLSIVVAAIGLGPVERAFMPHRHCLDAAGHPWLLWLTVAANIAIAGAYYVIPAMLIGASIQGYAPAPSLFYLFAAFILACGTTHVFDAWVMWQPIYYMQAAVLVLTAAISWVTVHAFVREALRARPAMALVGRKLREAADELRAHDVAGAQEAIAQALEMIAAHLERFQPPEGAHG